LSDTARGSMQTSMVKMTIAVEAFVRVGLLLIGRCCCLLD